MTENEIIILHDTLYEYLTALHEEDASFMFRMRRMDKESRLKKGYWFNGNLKYLETSFWDYKDNKHTTPIIRMVYYFDTQKWVCELVGRDNNERYQYFEKMEKVLGGFSKHKTYNIFCKELSNDNDFLNPLQAFIKDEKPRIDIYLKNNPMPNVVDFIRIEAFKKDKETVQKAIKITKKPTVSVQIKGLIVDYTSWKKINKDALHFALSDIHIEHFQGIKNLEICNIPLNRQWIFLTGENGFGKTSILRAIAKALVSGEEQAHFLSRESIIYVKGYSWGKPLLSQAIINELPNNFQIAAYGVSRFQLNGNSQEGSDISKLKTYSLFHDNGQLINIERVLIDAEQTKEKEKAKGTIPTTFDRLRDIFLKIIPKLSDIKVEYFENEPITNRFQVRYYEKSDNGEIYPPVKLNDLAAGYRSILTMMGDMIIRLSEDPNNAIDDLKGIVLIDEIDAHLHPKYQYELPNLLSSAFPKVQFIASTHSPIPILGVTANTAVVLTVHRTKELGITVERLDDDIEIDTLSANALLTSDIFNFKTIFARGATPDTIEPFDDYKDIREMKEMEKLLALKQGFKNFNIKVA